MTELVLIERADGVLTIAFNRPEKKNALTHAMYDAAARALVEADRDEAVRVVIITGSGDSFTGGNDLADFLQNPPGEESAVSRFLTALVTSQKPLIAAVNGVAVGIGVTMLLHCDLVYAAEGARLQLPFANIALVPEAASSLLMPRLIGHQKAAELFMFGEPFDVQTGAEMGLINRVLPASELMTYARQRAAILSAKAPGAIRATKALMKAGRTAIVEQMKLEAAEFGRRLASAEAREAMSAFFEKRPPDFKKFA